MADARALPFSEGRFDAVIANHMLYHVPDRARALSELAHVLKVGGRLFASTVGEKDLQEFDSLLQSSVSTRMHFARGFTLENGASQLSHWFGEIQIRRYEDSLSITEAEPLLAYFCSGILQSGLSAEKRADLSRLIQQRLTEQGAISITKDSGLFIAIRRSDERPG